MRVRWTLEEVGQPHDVRLFRLMRDQLALSPVNHQSADRGSLFGPMNEPAAREGRPELASHSNLDAFPGPGSLTSGRWRLMALGNAW